MNQKLKRILIIPQVKKRKTRTYNFCPKNGLAI